MLAETKAELDEFHHASKELEAELEAELARTEKSQQDLKVKVSKAESERDDWKVRRVFISRFHQLTSAPKSKFMALQTAHNTTTTSLQRELDRLRQEYQQLKVQLRELEMGNDDLERNERAVSSSLADMETKYSRVLEEKILLEQELLEKVSLEEGAQRLKDELRGPFLAHAFLVFYLRESRRERRNLNAQESPNRSNSGCRKGSCRCSSAKISNAAPTHRQSEDRSPARFGTSRLITRHRKHITGHHAQSERLQQVNFAVRAAKIERAQSRKSNEQPQVVRIHAFSYAWLFV